MIPLESVKARYQQARDLRGSYDSLFAELGRLFLPSVSDFWQQNATGQNRARSIVENSGLSVIQSLARDTTNALVPDGAKWVDISLAPIHTGTMDDTTKLEVKVQTETLTKMFDHYLRLSNIQTAVHTMALQFYTFGTAVAMPVVDANAHVHFVPLKVDRLSLAPSSDGKPPDVFWEREVTTTELLQLYPHYQPPTLQKDLKENRTRSLIYCFVRNTDNVVEEFVFVQKGAANDGRVNLNPLGIVSTDEIVHHFAYPVGHMPVIVGRMSEIPGESWGMGVGHHLLTEVQFQQTLRRHLLQASQLKSNPIFLVGPTAELGNRALEPGMQIPVSDRMSATDVPVRPVEVGGDIYQGLQVLEDSRRQVQNLNATMPMPYEVPSVRSATEWLAAQGLNESETSHHVRTFTTTILRPLFVSAITTLQMHGMFPPGVRVDGWMFDLVVKSDQERRKKERNLREIQSMAETQSMVDPIVAFTTIDQSKLLRKAAAALDLSDAVYPPEHTAMMIEQIQQQSQEGQQQEGEAQ